MRQPEAAVVEAGGVPAAGEGLPQLEGDLAETGAKLEGAQPIEFHEWTKNMWSASDKDLRWFMPGPGA